MNIRNVFRVTFFVNHPLHMNNRKVSRVTLFESIMPLLCEQIFFSVFTTYCSRASTLDSKTFFEKGFEFRDSCPLRQAPFKNVFEVQHCRKCSDFRVRVPMRACGCTYQKVSRSSTSPLSNPTASSFQSSFVHVSNQDALPFSHDRAPG